MTHPTTIEASEFRGLDRSAQGDATSVIERSLTPGLLEDIEDAVVAESALWEPARPMLRVHFYDGSGFWLCTKRLSTCASPGGHHGAPASLHSQRTPTRTCR